MNKKKLLQLRLSNQRLSASEFKTPVEVVSHFGAMQAQDYSMAKWAVGLRMNNAEESIIEKSINSGEIIRTHILRPTWHFVSNKDVRWMMEISAPYVKKAAHYVDKQVGLTDELFKKVWRIIAQQFKEEDNLTKEDIVSCLSKKKITVTNLLTTQIIIRAELEMLLCNGNGKGKDTSFALFEKRVAASVKIPRTEAITKLARIYFNSRGPATLKDFTWWSGLNISDAKAGIAELDEELEYFVWNGLKFYSSGHTQDVLGRAVYALLPSYDEYTVGYAEGREIALPADVDKSIIGNGIFKPLVLANNTLVGSWAITKKSPFIEIHPISNEHDSFRSKMASQIMKYKLFKKLC